jgi:hypothetical protein
MVRGGCGGVSMGSYFKRKIFKSYFKIHHFSPIDHLRPFILPLSWHPSDSLSHLTPYLRWGRLKRERLNQTCWG